MATVTKKFLNEVVYDENDLAAFLKAAGTVDMVKLDYEDGNIVVGDGVVVMDGFVYQIEGYDFLAPTTVVQKDVELHAYFGYNEQTETHEWVLSDTEPTDPQGFTQYVKVLTYDTRYTNQDLTNQEYKAAITSASPQGIVPYDLVHYNNNMVTSQSYVARLKNERNLPFYPETYRSQWGTIYNEPGFGPTAGSRLRIEARAIGTSHIEFKIEMQINATDPSRYFGEVSMSNLKPEYTPEGPMVFTLLGMLTDASGTSRDLAAITITFGHDTNKLRVDKRRLTENVTGSCSTEVIGTAGMYPVKRGQALMATAAEF